MIRKLFCLGVGVICVHLAGCGAQGEAYQPRPVPAAKSVIYLYRPYLYYELSSLPMITCGSESIELEGGGYYSWIQNSGAVKCTSSTEGTTPLTFDAHPGEEYFIKEEVASGGLGRHPQFTLMKPEIAREEIKDCRKQGVPDSESHR